MNFHASFYMNIHQMNVHLLVVNKLKIYQDCSCYQKQKRKLHFVCVTFALDDGV